MAQDRYKYFRVEVRELLDQLSTGVLDLEKGAATAETTARLLRLAHTLKGAARVVKQREMADGAHAIEEALAPHRESAVSVPRECIDTVLRLIDDIGARATALAPPEALVAAGDAADDIFRNVRTDAAEMDDLLNGVSAAYAQVAALRRPAALAGRARRLVGLLAAPRGLRWQGESGGSYSAPPLVEELRFVADQLARDLSGSVERLERELRQVRDTAERVRLVPADTLFLALERTARDIAQSLGKQVIFEGHGGAVRLDAQLLGIVQSALLQIVRNAVVHGIETEAERSQARKPVQGRVRLEVIGRGRQVIFRCKDDGRGVDLEAVRRVAERKGLLSSTARELDADRILQLLLRGGISTSGSVTEVSGRGIGLDVVRDAADRLGGEVSVTTTAGAGTVVELTVPLSLASLDVLVVEAEQTPVMIPLRAVRRTLRVAPADVAHTPQGQSVVYEGQVIPFLPLSRLLDRTTPAPAPRTWSAVVVESTETVAALGVDRLRGTANVVVAPFSELVPAVPVAMGVSLEADRTPRLVVDPDALVREIRRTDAAPPEPAHPARPILVIDDSLTTRMLEQSILESAGFDVDVVTSAEEALVEAGRKRYALFLVDVEMPGMDGFAFIERVRADPALRDTPAILVTSRDAPADRQRGQDVGAQDYLVKSEFDQDQFLARVRQLVN